MLRGASIFLLSLLFLQTFQQLPCDDMKSYFGCTTLLSCLETSGTCQCPNGNVCVWTVYGYHNVNCPCFDPANPDSFIQDSSFKALLGPDACWNAFKEYNCGHEITCNAASGTAVGTCKCPDESTCVFSNSVSVNCPCKGTYPSVETYASKQTDDCKKMTNEYNCPEDGIIMCRKDSGTCKCKNGDLCVWGSGYAYNCPCDSPTTMTDL